MGRFAADIQRARWASTTICSQRAHLPAVVGHQDKLLAKLMQGGYIASGQQEMLDSAMKLFAKPAPIKGETGC